MKKMYANMFLDLSSRRRVHLVTVTNGRVTDWNDYELLELMYGETTAFKQGRYVRNGCLS